MYKIIRFSNHGEETKVIKRNLTLEQAQAHCRREDTQEKNWKGDVLWFDGYEEQ